MNKKGFLLIDSLVCLIITVSISSVFLFTYNQLYKHEEVYKNYYEQANNKYEELYKSLPECIKCEIEEEMDLEEDF